MTAEKWQIFNTPEAWVIFDGAFIHGVTDYVKIDPHQVYYSIGLFLHDTLDRMTEGEREKLIFYWGFRLEAPDRTQRLMEKNTSDEDSEGERRPRFQKREHWNRQTVGDTRYNRERR